MTIPVELGRFTRLISYPVGAIGLKEQITQTTPSARGTSDGFRANEKGALIWAAPAQQRQEK